jgi:hypothetical protein
VSLSIPTRNNPKGRKSALNNIEAVTCAVMKQKQGVTTKKALYEMLEPPCAYKTFVETINRVSKILAKIVATVLNMNRVRAHWLKFTDATEIPVCAVKNAKRHKTMATLSTKSKSSKGWFYGLKLHVTADYEDRLLALKFTTAASDDRAVFKEINQELRGTFIVDAGYISKKLSHEFHIENERKVIVATRVNMRTLATTEQVHQLGLRMHIEKHFRVPKVMMNMCDTLCRSVDGYLTQYLSSLVAYMMTPRQTLLPLPMLS